MDSGELASLAQGISIIICWLESDNQLRVSTSDFFFALDEFFLLSFVAICSWLYDYSGFLAITSGSNFTYKDCLAKLLS